MAMLLSAQLPLGQFTPALTSYAGGIPVTANTTHGYVRGRFSRDERVNKFYGIPFAESTAGANRWQPPKPKTAWAPAVLDTIATAHCSQINAGPNVPGDLSFSSANIWGTEDCLKLDVITPAAGTPGLPATPAANTYAVAFWIHGGGMTIESFPIYQMKLNQYSGEDPELSYLPNAGQVVTVVGRYRLNYLGFMSHPALTLTSEIAGHSGNYGLLDVQAALTWVQNNIMYFGGNPDLVTIFGESAGATMTGLLFTSPLSYAPAVPKNLFRGAITESLWPVSGYGAIFSQKIRAEAADMVIGGLGCSGYDSSFVDSDSTLTSVAACLRGMADVQIQAASGNVTAWSAIHGDHAWEMISAQGFAAYPIVDGYVLTKEPYKLWMDGVNADTHIMIGSTADEMAFFVQAPLTTNYAINIQAAWFWASYNNPAMNASASCADMVMASAAFPGMDPDFTSSVMADKISAFYGKIVDPYQQQIAWLTDINFAVNHDRVFSILKEQPARTAGTLYRYLFAQPLIGALGTNVAGLGVPHTAELNWIWGYYANGKTYLTDNVVLVPGTFSYTEKELTMGLTMKKYWTAFFVTGSPNHASDGVPDWEPITHGAWHTMVFKAGAPTGYGSMLDPCAQITACLPETTGRLRGPAADFWNNNLATTMTLDNCAAPVVGYSHVAPAQYSSTCPLNPCCSARRSRKLLFGMPGSGTDTSNCDSLC